LPKIVAVMSTWNNALWIEYNLRHMYDLVDHFVIQECNWTEDDPQWTGDTSPDGTADLIRSLPDPGFKFHFYQLGRWTQGCLAARAELCSHIPACDWVYVMDADEFVGQRWLSWLDQNLPQLQKRGYTTISQSVRGFYWDFSRHTNERFTRWMRWYPNINCWFAQYPRPADFDAARAMPATRPLDSQLGSELFHYSYVPTQGVRIKGAKSFDVSPERYDTWYQLFRSFDGTDRDLERIYAANQGGVHVFGGMPVDAYSGPHPEVLANHPLRHGRWNGTEYRDAHSGQPIPLTGWWNPGEPCP
jgi:hypothetical protein